MSNVELSLHVYQRPVQGNSFLGRFRAFQYRHSIVAAGGFDTASCTIKVPRRAIDVFLEDRLGCRVAVYADNPVEPIWEGFINRVTVPMGAASFTTSLDEMTNRTVVLYTNPDASTTTPQLTATTDNTDSQAIYGIKEGVIEGGLFQGGNVTRKPVLRDTVLAINAFPQKSLAPSAGSDVQIEMLGWYHTLDWVKYYEPNSVAVSGPSDYLQQLLPLYPNTPFFSLSDFSLIDLNTSWLGNRRMQSARTFLQQIRAIQEIGNGLQQWIWGITPTSPNDGVRRLYFRPATTTIRYHMRSSDLIVRDVFNRPVKPWLVRPDAGVLLTDMMLAWNGVGDDPREFYAGTVQYDAERQSVTIASSDDITPEGVFGLRRYYRRIGKEVSRGLARLGWP